MSRAGHGHGHGRRPSAGRGRRTDGPALRLALHAVDAVAELAAHEQQLRRELLAPTAPATRTGRAQQALARAIARYAAVLEATGALVLRDVAIGRHWLALLAIDGCCGALLLVEALRRPLPSRPRATALVPVLRRLQRMAEACATGAGPRWRVRALARAPWDVAYLVVHPPTGRSAMAGWLAGELHLPTVTPPAAART